MTETDKGNAYLKTTLNNFTMLLEQNKDIEDDG